MIDLGAAMLRQLPAETAHRATLALLRAAGPWLPAPAPDDPRLSMRALGFDFANPIGLAAGFDKAAALADYVTVNVSSPNTPGLRGLQNREELTRLLGAVTEARVRMTGGAASSPIARKPILLKIAPDLDLHALDEIADVVRASGIEGLIVSNTTTARPNLKSRHAGEAGRRSGKPP